MTVKEYSPKFDFGSPDCAVTLCRWDAMYPKSNRDISNFSKQIRLRDAYIEHCGFHIVTKELVDTIGPYLQGKVVEVGAGSGWFAAHLRAAGHKMTCYDNGSWEYPWTPHTEILAGDGATVVSDADTVIMCWPDYNMPFAHEVAMSMKSGAHLLHCGEGSGGCTGNNDFHDLVCADVTCATDPSEIFRDKIWDVNRRFSGVHDSWSLWQKP